MPAIRSASHKDPWRCPWCGVNAWFVSEGDDARDKGRVQMYCDNDDCDSRETELLVVRGHDEEHRARADIRADVRALRRIDDGGIEGREVREVISLTSAADWRESEERGERRAAWRRSEEAYSIDVP